MRPVLPYFLLVYITSAFILPAHAFNLPDQELHHYQCKHCGKLSHQTLLTSWLIEDKKMVPAKVTPTISKRYYRQVTGKELKQGVELGLLGDGAIIRINPTQSKPIPPKWQQKFSLRIGHQKNALSDMVQSLSDEQELKQQFAVGPAIIFQLKPGLSQQKPFLVYNDAKLDDNSQWQISVSDLYCDLYLSVALDKNRYGIGDNIKAAIEINELTEAKENFSLPAVHWIEARAMGPSGQGMYVPLQEDGILHYEGNLSLDSNVVAPGENWYFQVMADIVYNGQHILRTASVPFSYVVPSAKIRSIYRPSNLNPLSLKAKVESIQASRYQLQAVFYATGDDGELHSVALAQTSAWITPGVSELSLEVKTPLPSNVHSPYYLGQIELIDDAQLKPVYRYFNKISLSQLDR